MSTGPHHHVWFGPRDRPLSGWLAVPADGKARGAVLLCGPLGDEARSTRRTFRRLAEALVSRGLASLRMDYDGFGDSAGEYDDPDPVLRWLASIREGRAELESLGFERVAGVGMRLGATLLTSVAAADENPLSSLVLWDPCSGGRAFLREAEALYRLGDHEPGEDGLVHTPGFHYDAAAVASLGTLDLGTLKTPNADRVLVLTRHDRPVPRVVRHFLDRLGAVADRKPAHGQDKLLDVAPVDAVVPTATMQEIVDWVAARTCIGVHDVIVPEDAPVSFAARDQTLVREEVVELAAGTLRGVVSTPLETPAGDAPWIVLNNVALEYHTGPGRQWVTLARKWAALGFRCVRLDLSGVGESPAHPGSQEDELFSPNWLLDGPAVVGELGGQGAPVCMVGICSGAYTALEAAMVVPVDAVVSVNSIITIYSVARGQPAFSPDRLVARVPWGWLGRLAISRRKLAGGIWRVHRQFAFWNAPITTIRRVAARGTTVLLAGNPHDVAPYQEVVAWWPVRLCDRLLARLRRSRGGIRIVREDALDHPVLTLAGRRAVDEIATGFLLERYGARGRGDVS